MTQIGLTAAATSGLEGAPVAQGHAFITEMFSGIQGEGPFVGIRQIFVRLGGCDLRCHWCDTPDSLVRRGPGRYEATAGSRDFVEHPNPITFDEAAILLQALQPRNHHSVTFTGGEPLLQPDAIRALSEEVRSSGGRTWLETHGGRVAEMAEVVDAIDIVSMDVKLASSAGDWVSLDAHREFLEVARTKDVFVKIVITPDTETDEVVGAAVMIAATAPGTALILQQVTPFGRVKASPTPERMLELQERCLQVHRDVRVIPQTHKLTGQL